MLTGLRALKGLYLHGNELTYVPKGFFRVTGNLANLLLGSNKINSVPVDMFRPLQSLLALNLDDNIIRCSQISQGDVVAWHISDVASTSGNADVLGPCTCSLQGFAFTIQVRPPLPPPLPYAAIMERKFVFVCSLGTGCT